ncbi:MAG: type I CRISPR-associated protein Cas7 [Oscillospiraceae bacterium]|nr:type I CRISPR-associated protein Cas7 [Oscillospiraceae bacterium]
MNKRVYGICGIKSIMSNWNADFTGYPKSISTGEYFGSDKALKYPMKKMWMDEGELVLNIKTFKFDEKEGKLRPKSLKERYEELFEVKDLKQEKDNKKTISNIFKAIDVKNFGSTFAVENSNFSITGAVQITQGFNKYSGMTPEEQQILSPFRAENSQQRQKNEEADNTTLGTKIVANEAHYFYTFVVNPKAYDEYVKLGVTEGYTEKDYEKFKDAAISSATAFNTNSKIGCENEFTMFIEVEKDLYLPDIANYIEFVKNADKDEIILKCHDLLKKVSDRILKIEIYYNVYKLKRPDLKGIDNVKYFDIFTKEVCDEGD